MRCCLWRCAAACACDGSLFYFGEARGRKKRPFFGRFEFLPNSYVESLDLGDRPNWRNNFLENANGQPSVDKNKTRIASIITILELF